jgi:hypothetical protein
MHVNELIDGYVADVVRRLPSRQRRDVGVQLRARLEQELHATARAVGRPADAALATQFLRAFGRPEEVAGELGPAGVLDRDPVSRPLVLLALAFWAAGALLWIALAWFGSSLPGALPYVFAFDRTFMATRGPWVLPMWLAGFALSGVLIVDGRWRRRTRKISVVLNATLCAVVIFFVAEGPIFQLRTTDEAAKAALAIIVVAALIDLPVRLYRNPAGLRPDLAEASGA